MRHSIISAMMAMTMLVSTTGSALAVRQSQGQNGERATYIDISKESENNSNNKNQGQNQNQPEQQQQEDNMQNQPADESMMPDNSTNSQSEADPKDDTIDAEKYKDENQDEYLNNSTSESSSIFVWISLIVAAIALAFSVLTYHKLVNLEKQRKARAKSSSKSSQLDEIYDRLGILENSFARINNRLNEFPKQSNPIQKSVTHFEHKQSSRSTQPISIKKYACTVIGEGFPVDSVADNPESDTIAVLTVKGNRGTFVINPDENAQRRLLMNFSYSVGRISDVIRKSEMPSTIVTVTPGEVELRGEEWVIVRKATVKLD